MSAPSDDELGRLLAEGLRRGSDAPVDEYRLVAGAREGAGRIRRRRRTLAQAAAGAVLVVPVVLFGPRLLGGGSSDDATSAGAASSAEKVAGSVADAAGGSAAAGSAGEPSSISAVSASALAGPLSASAPAAGSAAATRAVDAATGTKAPAVPSAPPSRSVPALPTTPPRATPPTPGTTRSTGATTAATSSSSSSSVSGPAGVPASALLTAADLVPVTGSGLARTTDTGSTSRVPAPAAVDVCGQALGALPAEESGRAVGYQRASGTTAWVAGSTVRSFAGSGASAYLVALGRQECLGTVAVAGADTALAGHGPADSTGRTHWFAVARSGATVTEVRLSVPKGGTVTTASMARLLQVAVAHLAGSGLPIA